MQVPLIDRLTDFQAGFNSLQNPSFPSQITTNSFNGIQTFSIAFNFCKWGAVILALVATFSSIIKKVTIFIIHLRKKASSLPSISFDDGDDFTSDDEDTDNDDIVSLSSSSECEDESPSVSNSTSFNDFFRITGSSYDVNDVFQTQNDGHKRQRSIGDIFSLLELANSENVVKLWDSIGFGLGLDFDDYEDGVISSYDVVTKPHAPSTSVASPAVVVSAGEGARGNLAVEIWDTRLRRRKPSVVAEWGPTVGNTVRVESGGVQKVYVRDDGRQRLTVGDMRKVSVPLGNVTESDADSTWWDADAVIVSDETYGEH
ncbi:hypothetical protein L195_g037582 [Trifolium pratense]|uniref:Uncharacterized protein n=2 Tax=Trifolium pratense TaxID=57577 RepID=A0ACB0JVW5_TRIPR|nr:hypothetical protein L195_g037582 [Trifolium pratense]CAJ2648426.1 unnamed protein product [Trifolium pratense]